MQSPDFPQTPAAALRQDQPDRPVLYLSPQALQARARRFQAGFPGLVTYAVKANPHPTVLQNLVAAGLHAFDVASPDEIAAVRAVSPRAALHYNNPVRARSEIAAGIAAGVVSWSVDEASELAKLGDAPRDEVAVRFKLPVPGAAYDFGEKFGAEPEAACALLKQVKDMGFTPSLTFHPGTQCEDPQAWTRYIEAAAGIAEQAGLRIARLNVGGGFPQNRGQGAPDLEETFRVIAQARKAFGCAPPDLLCEPGRAMVAEAASLAVRVKSRRGDTLYLNDGIYGGLTELKVMGASGLVDVLDSQGCQKCGQTRVFRAFGPTCDSLDCIPGGLLLPEEIAPDDYILIGGMGAYSNCIATRFNGYGAIDLKTIARVSGQPEHNR